MMTSLLHEGFDIGDQVKRSQPATEEAYFDPSSPENPGIPFAVFGRSGLPSGLREMLPQRDHLAAWTLLVSKRWAPPERLRTFGSKPAEPRLPLIESETH